MRGVLLLAAAVLAGPTTADEIRPEFAMDEDPPLIEPAPEWRLQDGIVDLWKQALQRPEADYQRLAAEAIAEAAEDELPGLESTRTHLRQIVSRNNGHAAAVYAAARALIAMDDRQSAALLWEAGQTYGQSVRLLVEPTLAAWEFSPAASTWQQRLNDPHTGRSDLKLALGGLARLEAAEALDTILTIVHAVDRAADVRLAAARAAGAITETGLHSDAVRLNAAPRGALLPRLLAVALLQRHATPEAIEVLEQLAVNDEPTVAEPALGRLLEVDPQRALPFAAAAIDSRDPKLRRRGVDVYVALPAPERVRQLADLLDDPHPMVRRSVCGDLYRLASQPELRTEVLQGGTRVLAAESWRGQEQAALLLGALDHKPAASRLVELLTSERAEVMVSTAWALRKLAVDDTRAAMVQHARRQTALRLREKTPEGLDEQVAHLFEALGLMKEPAADDLLRDYIPKRHSYGYYSRGAAIWALGRLHEGEPDEALATQLMERLNDFDLMDPELDIVWEMSAVSLGRMQAVSQETALRDRLKEAFGRTRLAIRWALGQLSSEPLPPAPLPEVRYRTNWFLEPAGRKVTAEPSR